MAFHMVGNKLVSQLFKACRWCSRPTRVPVLFRCELKQSRAAPGPLFASRRVKVDQPFSLS